MEEQNVCEKLHAYHLFHRLRYFPVHLPFLWLNLFQFHPRDFQQKHLVEVVHHHLPDPEVIILL